MSDKLCPFLRSQAAAVAITMGVNADAQRAAQPGPRLIPDPMVELVGRLLNTGWILEAQRCTGERCAWWDHTAQECSQLRRGGDPMWWKLPEGVVRAVVRGKLTPADCLVCLVVGLWIHVDRGSWSWVQAVTGLSRRALAYSLAGRDDDRRLQPFLVRDGGGVRWAPFRCWCRVGWRDVRGLLQRPTQDAVRAWAWSLLQVSGRQSGPARADVRDLARACGWSYGRAYRALWGAADRAGAVDLELVILDGDHLESHYPRAVLRVGPVDKLAEALRRTLDPCVHKDVRKLGQALAELDRGVRDTLTSRAPSSPSTGDAVPNPDPVVHSSCARIDILYQWVRSGSTRSKRLLVDLLAERAKQTGMTRDDLQAGGMVETAAKWLESCRVNVPRGTSWDRGVVRKVLALAADRLPTRARVIEAGRQALRKRLRKLLALAHLGAVKRRAFLEPLRLIRRGELDDAREALDHLEPDVWSWWSDQRQPLICYSHGRLP